MKHEVKKLEKSAVEIKMSLTKDEFGPIKNEILTAAQKTVEIPGFRKGHAPIDQIEAKYADGIKEELTDKVFKKYFTEVVEAEKLEPISPLYSVKVDLTEDTLDITASIDVFPEVTLGDYKGVEIEKATFEMSDEKLDAEIDVMLHAGAELVDTEAGYKAEMGDTVDLAFEGFMDGVPFEGGKADSHILKLGSKMFIDNFEEQLVGMVAGEEKEITVNFPENYQAAELAGKPAVFKVKINAVKQLKTPELNDEFAKAKGFESVEDLKAKTAETVKTRGEEDAKNQNRGNLLRKVTENATVEVPQSLVMKEIEVRIGEFEQQLAMQGMDFKSYLQMTGMTMDSMLAQLAPMAESKVRMDLVLGKISDVEGLKASDEEINAKVEEIAKMYNMTAEKIKEELEKTNRYEAFLNSVKTDIVMSKAIELVEANAK